MEIPGWCKLNRLIPGILLLILVAAAGCGEVKPTRIGEAATSFRLANLAGDTVDTASGRGKAQVIYFWNDQCGCVEQLAQMRGFVSAQKDASFSFITVNVGQGKEVVGGFVTKYNLPYTVLLDSDRKITTKQVGIKVLPTILVIDKSGILREKLMGIVTTKKLEDLITRYL